MDAVKFTSKGNIKMIAHRGLSGIERENTCPAFVAAANRSYYGIETDVHITKDGKFILCHDSNLERVAGIDKIIEESSFDELRKIRFTDSSDNMQREDIFLPTPEEYLHICKKYGKIAVLEIKGTFEEGALADLVGIIDNAEMIEQTIFISFSKQSCLRLKKILPTAKIQFLAGKEPEDNADFCIENGFDADFHFSMITKDLIDKLHANGLSVNCWTVNSLEDAELMKTCGIDFITSNILE